MEPVTVSEAAEAKMREAQEAWDVAAELFEKSRKLQKEAMRQALFQQYPWIDPALIEDSIAKWFGPDSRVSTPGLCCECYRPDLSWLAEAVNDIFAPDA